VLIEDSDGRGAGATVLWRRLVAEFLGSAFLAAVVVGSGIGAQQLSPGVVGLELLENALPAQVAGCASGAVLANLMVARPAVSISTRHRATGAHFLSEVVATAGLLLVIFALARTGRGSRAPPAVGLYISGAPISRSPAMMSRSR